METLPLKVSCLCVSLQQHQQRQQYKDGDIIYLICFTHHFNLFHFRRINFAVVSCALCRDTSDEKNWKIVSGFFAGLCALRESLNGRNLIIPNVIFLSPSHSFPLSALLFVLMDRGRTLEIFYFIYIFCVHKNSKQHRIVNICALFNVLLILYFHHRSRTSYTNQIEN